MKILDFIAPFLKSLVGVVSFMVGIGWASYGAVLLIVKAEGNEIRQEVKTIREVDMSHLDKRFDRIERLIKEER